MKVLISTQSASLKSAIAKKLIPLGITTITFNTLEELSDLIPFVGKVCFIDEIDLPTRDLLNTIETIKKNHPNEGVRVVLLTKNFEPQHYKTYTEKGIDTVIQNSLHTDTIADRFVLFVNKFCSQDSRRKYLRIRLDNNEPTSLKILIPSTQKYVEGKITDISMGGLAADFDPEELKQILPTVIYNRTQIIVEHKNIISDIVLLKKAHTNAAFSFSKLPPSFQDTLSEYILCKIQTCMEGGCKEESIL